ncbi:MAG: hypothetical protein AAFO07_20450, partial [Bacteroidota bacterium]
MENQDLILELQEWDGKHVDYLIDIYDNYSNQDVFFDQLLEISTIQVLQTATTWLIKHHYDQKQSLNQHQIDNLLGISTELVHWEAQLHVLQLLPKVKISETILPIVDEFVNNCLESKKKFVRAWAYQGFYELTKHRPEYKEPLRL